MSKTFEIKLTEFSFPNKLDESKSNFRFVVDLRFIDAKGDPGTIHTILPGLDDFWECDPREREKDKALLNYVRHQSDSAFDMGDTSGTKSSATEEGSEVKIRSAASISRATPRKEPVQVQIKPRQVRDWDKLIFRVKGQKLNAIQFKVFDVNRKDAWDRIRSVLQKLPRAFAGPLGPAVGVVEEGTSVLLAKAAGSGKLLFRGDINLNLDLKCFESASSFIIKGEGLSGDYKIGFNCTCPSLRVPEVESDTTP